MKKYYFYNNFDNNEKAGKCIVYFSPLIQHDFLWKLYSLLILKLFGLEELVMIRSLVLVFSLYLTCSTHSVGCMDDFDLDDKDRQVMIYNKNILILVFCSLE